MSQTSRQVRRSIYRVWKRARFPGSGAYWELNYADGGGSGPGSTGTLAEFKADVINDFVARNNVDSVVDFGCGDGQQLLLANYPRYLGLDVSPSVIQRCIGMFAGDNTKSFLQYVPGAFHDPAGFLTCDLALSLDVVYHLVEDEVYEQYLTDLFASAKRFVIIYGYDADDPKFIEPYSHPRKFTSWVDRNCPDWTLADVVRNRYPARSQGHGPSSWSDFFIFRKDP